MIILAGTEDDIPEILSLYQLALGNADGLRTEAYWRWKHIQNPFGASPILLARDNGKLVGMRAFLKWRFRFQGNSFLAFRAVDTATHPDYRGKGIFTKLTMALVDQIQSGEPALIFNTPNNQSKPGYLKMGWKEFGKTKLQVKINPLNIIMNRISLPTTPLVSLNWDELEIEQILSSWSKAHNHVVTTQYSMEYLRWRYKQVPAVFYLSKRTTRGDCSAVFLYRVKKSRGFQELRINEIFYTGSMVTSLLKSSINELNEMHRPDVITILADNSSVVAQALPFGFFKAEAQGLTITYRKVNDDKLVGWAQNPDTWYFSAGTLELF